MIPVLPQPEPPHFEARVRARGRLVAVPTPPPPVKSQFWKGKEYWRDALGDLFDAYAQVCAFSGFRIERVTGARSVEHFQPKGKYPQLAYEWANFRLVCSLMNGRKRDFEDVLDPFLIPNETFDLNPVSGKVLVHRNCPQPLRAQAENTISRLKLNDGECTAARIDHIQRFFALNPEIRPMDSPFVHACLLAQGLV